MYATRRKVLILPEVNSNNITESENYTDLCNTTLFHGTDGIGLIKLSYWYLQLKFLSQE